MDAIKITLDRLGLKLNKSSSIDSRLSSPPKTKYSNFLTTFREFSKYIADISLQVIAPSSPGTAKGEGTNQKYRGVWLGYLPDKTILAYDGTSPPGAINLQYQEFIGQPTWMTDGGVIQSVHPMRNDISVGFDIQYPKNIPANTNPLFAGAGRYNVLNASSQKLRVQQVRHLGRFRDTSPTGWVTYVNAAGAAPINSYPNNQ